MKKIIITTLLSILSIPSFAIPPEAPVLTSEVKDLKVSISWSETENASGYAIYYVKAPYIGPEQIERIDQGNTNSYSVSLYPGADYFVAVKAYNVNQEESEYSNIEFISVNKIQVVNMSLNRHRYDDVELKEGTFQLLVDVDQQVNYSSIELFAPDNSSYGHFNIKDDNQAEFFVREDLAFMEPHLLAGEYRISDILNDQAGETLPLISIEKGFYPSYPEIIVPAHNAINVKTNPTITFITKFPTNLSITDTETNEEVFFSRNLDYTLEADGSKTVNIDSVNLKPDTQYLLEINEFNRDVAKGSTTAIAFKTR